MSNLIRRIVNINLPSQHNNYRIFFIEKRFMDCDEKSFIYNNDDESIDDYGEKIIDNFYKYYNNINDAVVDIEDWMEYRKDSKDFGNDIQKVEL